MMIINHNIPALNTYNRLFSNNNGMAKSLEKLSSGLRINRAADDAAGLAISEKMRAQIRGLEQAKRNAQDGISLVQTAEGALAEDHAILQRMRELSVQAANDTYTSNDRMEIQREIDQLKDEINRIAASTQFNNKNLLDGTTSALVSTDMLTTKVFMRGELRQVDQFGQKAPGGGNYRINIRGDAGLGQVQKSDIFKVKHAGENAIVTANIGYTVFDGAVELAGGSTAETDLSMSVVIDGARHDMSLHFWPGTPATTRAMDIVSAINTNSAINSVLRAYHVFTAAGNADFAIERIDKPEATFSFSWGADSIASAVATSAMTIAGEGMSGATGSATMNAISQNITGITPQVSSMLEGEYEVNTIIGTTGGVTAPGTMNMVYLQSSAAVTPTVTSFGPNPTINQSMEMTLQSISGNDLTFAYRYFEKTMDTGTVTSASGTLVVVAGSGGIYSIGSLQFTLDFSLTPVASYTVGDKIVANTVPLMQAGTTRIAIDHTTTAGRTAAFTQQQRNFIFNTGVYDYTSQEFNFFQMEQNTASASYGQVNESIVSMTFDQIRQTADYAAGIGDRKAAASFTIAAGSTIGNLAGLQSKLYDLDRFWDASGNFVLENPQTIYIVQGDGAKTSVTLFSSDTIQDVMDKLNEAIGEGLKQNELGGMAGLENNYVSYVTTAVVSGLDAVAGTMVIRSARTGKDGELLFMGDDATINALSLMQIQASKENMFSVDVYEAHKGTVITEDYTLEDNTLVGVIHPNVDVKFDPNTGVEAAWDSATNTFEFNGIATGTTTYVHIADRSMIFQIGANSMQDIAVGIGNISAEALGINGVMVTSNRHANQAIRTLDAAIGRVSVERSRLGAVQNRLDHTISNLSTTAENLIASESRIRDVDMAKEMMNFTRFNILSQAATAMLAQANQLPQSVLQLLR